jgi:hypothetical protein
MKVQENFVKFLTKWIAVCHKNEKDYNNVFMVKITWLIRVCLRLCLRNRNVK